MVSGLLSTTAPALFGSERLAGTLPLDPALLARWPWSGTWAWPVGAAGEYLAPGGPGQATWHELRGFSTADSPHLGADLGDGREGDPVRAAAHGVVAFIGRGEGGGYGSHVVIAHRLREGGIAYSVYSHLRPGSMRVREGQIVWQGQILGQVGRSGRATTFHLHFEVRVADELDARWERERAVNPVRFVAERLPVVAADSGWDAPYLDWAQRAGLTEPGPHRAEGLPLGLWEKMLARAARLPLLDVPQEPAALHEVLVGHGLRPEGVTPERGTLAAWPELARDVARLARQGTRLPRGPLQVEPHRAACLARLACRSPAHAGAALRKRRDPPTLADACLLLADAAGPTRPPARRKPHAPAARPAPAP